MTGSTISDGPPPPYPDRADSDSRYQLVVSQLKLEHHPIRYEHWGIVALESIRSGKLFHLVDRGDGSLVYRPHWTDSYGGHVDYCGGFHIGSFHKDDLGKVEAKFEAVRIPLGKSRREFDCQTWVVDALLALRPLWEEGIVHLTDAVRELTSRNEMYVRVGSNLQEARHRYECSEWDCVEGELFPEELRAEKEMQDAALNRR